MCMRLQEVIANKLALNCWTNSLRQYYGKCIENIMENMYFDEGIKVYMYELLTKK